MLFVWYVFYQASIKRDTANQNLENLPKNVRLPAHFPDVYVFLINFRSFRWVVSLSVLAR